MLSVDIILSELQDNFSSTQTRCLEEKQKEERKKQFSENGKHHEDLQNVLPNLRNFAKIPWNF